MKINADPNEICQALDYIRDTLKNGSCTKTV